MFIANSFVTTTELDDLQNKVMSQKSKAIVAINKTCDRVEDALASRRKALIFSVEHAANRQTDLLRRHRDTVAKHTKTLANIDAAALHALNTDACDGFGITRYQDMLPPIATHQQRVTREVADLQKNLSLSVQFADDLNPLLPAITNLGTV